MSKTIYTILIALAVSLLAFPATAQLASWNLTTDTSPDLVATDLQASNFKRGNGISALTHNGYGASATGWPMDFSMNAVDYYEVCIIPQAGHTFDVSEIKFKERRNANGIQAYQVFWSVDNFHTSERLDSIAAPDADLTRSIEITNLDRSICDGQPLCIRWYGYGASSDAGNWSINSIEVEGMAQAVCTPPIVQTRAITFSNIQDHTVDVELDAGSGDRRLVIVSEGKPVEAFPCSGTEYTANNIFGLGSEIMPGNFVVFDGSGLNFTLSGLIAGETYHFAVMEYNSIDRCYLTTDPLRDAVKTGCSSPVLPEKIVANPGSNTIALMWDIPTCYDEVLIVASTSAISGMPNGDGSAYSDNPAFGSGLISNGTFTASTFPVYQGTADRIEVTGINNINYYFVLYARLGTDWTDALEIQARGMDGCEDLGEDVVFINEMHYLNIGTDQDEGVEIAGPAGVDLSAYMLVLYEYPADTFYHIEYLEGVIDDEQDGKGAVWFPIPDMYNQRGGVVLYNIIREEIVQFYSYRGLITPIDGVAMGIESRLLLNQYGSGETEFSGSPAEGSVQLLGSGSCPSEMYWNAELLHSRGSINSGQALLPIELLYFKGTLLDEQVLLSWQTVNEVDNDYMAVERSADGRVYQEIGRVQGAGTTNIPQSYQLVDEAPFRGTNYYRLRQVDFNGSVYYSPVVVVQLEGGGPNMVVFPTVTADWATVTLNGLSDQGGELVVFNQVGQQVTSISLDTDEQSITISAADWVSGMYYVQLVLPNERITKQLIKR